MVKSKNKSIYLLGLFISLILISNINPIIYNSDNLVDIPNDEVLDDYDITLVPKNSNDFIIVNDTASNWHGMLIDEDTDMVFVSNFASGPGFQTYNISDSPNIVSLDNLSIEGQHGDPEFNPDADVVYQTGLYSEWRVVNVSDPTNLQVLNSVATPSCCINTKYRNGYLYANVAYNGVQVYNATSNATHPSYVTIFPDSGWNNAMNIHPSMDLLFLGGWDSDFFIINISDPSNPTTLKNMGLETWHVAVHPSNPYLAYAAAPSGMYIMNLTDLNDITTSKSFPEYKCKYIESYGNLLVSVNGVNGNTSYYDISDPLNPILIESFFTQGDTTNIVFHDEFVYISQIISFTRLITKNPLYCQLSTDADTPDTDGLFYLNWTEISGADNYSIYVHDSYITNINSSVTCWREEVNTLTYPYYNLNNGTYYFKVVAHTGTSNISSNCISATTSYYLYPKASYDWDDPEGASDWNWDEAPVLDPRNISEDGFFLSYYTGPYYSDYKKAKIVKYNTTGNQEWIVSTDDFNYHLCEVEALPNRGCVGAFRQTDGDFIDFMKINESGSAILNWTWNPTDTISLTDMKLLNEELWVIGHNSTSTKSIVICRFNLTDGSIIELTNWNTGVATNPGGVCLDRNGGLYITGYNETGGHEGLFLLHVNSSADYINATYLYDVASEKRGGSVAFDGTFIFIVGINETTTPDNYRSALWRFNPDFTLNMSTLVCPSIQADSTGINPDDLNRLRILNEKNHEVVVSFTASHDVLNTVTALINSAGEVIASYDYGVAGVHEYNPSIVITKSGELFIIIDRWTSGSDHPILRILKWNFAVNPLGLDPDWDGLSNWDEENLYNTDPYDSDSDDDGYSDGEEVANGWDPNDPNDPPSFWIFSPIIIDNDGGGDYTWAEAANEDWCSGFGIWNNPYILENITIDGGGASSCLTIRDSDVYFIIRNCTITNGATAGILLDNTNFGTIINNLCISNQYGIVLSDSDNNNITENTANSNTLSGVALFNSHNNSIYDNYETFDGNTPYGILLQSSNDTVITNNNIRNSDYGIYLIASCNNNITLNNLYNNDVHYYQDAASTGNIYANNLEGSDPSDTPTDDEPDITPPDFPIIIIIIIIIIGAAVGISAGAVVTIKKKSSESKDKMKKERTSAYEAPETTPEVPSEPPLKEIKPVTPMKPPKAVKSAPPKGKKPKKSKGIEAPVAPIPLTKEEMAELEKTESEIAVEKKEYVCIVHKGPMDADNIYLCPKCHSLYCINCARVLKEKGDRCWSCENEILVKTPESIMPAQERQEKIKRLEVRLASLKTTVKNLDENFFAGDLTEADYNAMRKPLLAKVSIINQELTKLRE